MTCTFPYTPRADAATTLRDFTIQGAAEIGECHGAQSFRAARQLNGQPVLLHKFRPAAPLTALGPLVTDRTPPDFNKPFITRFSDLFAVAGSAYLVEPLPVCSGLSDVWRHVLQKRPHQAVTVMAVLIRQMIAITNHLRSHSDRHGALDLENIVLVPAGSFGILASRVECKEGTLWLRRNPKSPPLPDCHGLVEVLGSLLDLDTEIASLQRIPKRLPIDIHRKIRSLLHAMHRAQLDAHRPSSH